MARLRDRPPHSGLLTSPPEVCSGFGASSLFVFLIIAALLGIGAASWPARRAAKLAVLAAIAPE